MSLVLFYACGLSFGRLVIKMYVAKAEPAALSAPQSKTKTTKIYFLFFSPFPLFPPPLFILSLRKQRVQANCAHAFIMPFFLCIRTPLLSPLPPLNHSSPDQIYVPAFLCLLSLSLYAARNVIRLPSLLRGDVQHCICMKEDEGGEEEGVSFEREV